MDRMIRTLVDILMEILFLEWRIGRGGVYILCGFLCVMGGSEEWKGEGMRRGDELCI
jgi:hypothetical protein